jgi:hypothetical protein
LWSAPATACCPLWQPSTASPAALTQPEQALGTPGGPGAPGNSKGSLLHHTLSTAAVSTHGCGLKMFRVQGEFCFLPISSCRSHHYSRLVLPSAAALRSGAMPIQDSMRNVPYQCPGSGCARPGIQAKS